MAKNNEKNNKNPDKKVTENPLTEFFKDYDWREDSLKNKSGTKKRIKKNKKVTENPD